MATDEYSTPSVAVEHVSPTRRGKIAMAATHRRLTPRRRQHSTVLARAHRRSMPRSARFAVVLLSVLACATALTVSAGASGAAPLSLQGEILSPDSGTFTNITCIQNGTSTYDFTAVGSAYPDGPYPGTFTESGSVTIGPQTISQPQQDMFGAGVVGPLISFQSTFTITSGTTTITGTKVGPVAPFTNALGTTAYGVCLNPGQVNGVGQTQDGSEGFANNANYQATIHTPTGDFADSGRTFTSFSEQDLPPWGPSLGGIVTFPVSQGVVPLGPTSVTLTPPDAVNNVGTSHTVTATASASGNPFAGASILFAVSGDANTAGSCTTDSSGTCSFTYAGPRTPGSDTITGCADNNGNGTVDAGEPCGQATKTWVVPTLAATPPDAVNTVGTNHTVTASITSTSGASEAGRAVAFSVSGSVATSGSCTTGASGSCSFTYAGPQLPGGDLITVCSDLNRDGTVATATECVEVTKAWLLPTSTPGQVTGGGQVFNATNTDQVAFGFNAKNSNGTPKGECNLVDPTGANTKIKCLDVTALVESGTHATFFGNATINGAATTYRIDINDLGEPGAGHDTFTIQTASGYSAGGVLVHGNIQIH
jgi:hypothetical protein